MNPVQLEPVSRRHYGASALKSLRGSWLLTGGVVVLVASILKLLVHLYASRHYGYFTDELYYLACARHLAWGYVDQPPLIAVMTWLSAALFGEALPAIRLLPVMAGVGRSC